MKKSLKYILIIILIFIFMLILFFIFKNIKKNVQSNTYNIYIVGNNCNCVLGFGQKCKYTYGINENESKELDITFEEDKSNFYRIFLQQKCDNVFRLLHMV